MVQPALAGLALERQGAEEAHPLVGLRRPLRLGRSVAEAELAMNASSTRLLAEGAEVHADAEPERQHVAQRDRPLGRHRLVERARRVDQHPPVG